MNSLTDRQKVALSLLNMNRRAVQGKVKRADLKPEQKEFLKSLPDHSAFTPRGLFLSHKLRGVSASETKLSDSFTEAVKAWAALSPNDQEAYAKMAQKNLDNYIDRINIFLKN